MKLAEVGNSGSLHVQCTCLMGQDIFQDIPNVFLFAVWCEIEGCGKLKNSGGSLSKPVK